MRVRQNNLKVVPDPLCTLQIDKQQGAVKEKAQNNCLKLSQLTPSVVNTPGRIPSTTQSTKQDPGLDHLCSHDYVFAEIQG